MLHVCNVKHHAAPPRIRTFVPLLQAELEQNGPKKGWDFFSTRHFDVAPVIVSSLANVRGIIKTSVGTVLYMCSWLVPRFLSSRFYQLGCKPAGAFPAWLI